MLSSSARGTPWSFSDSRTHDASMRNVWATVGFSNWETRGGDLLGCFQRVANPPSADSHNAYLRAQRFNSLL